VLLTARRAERLRKLAMASRAEELALNQLHQLEDTSQLDTLRSERAAASSTFLKVCAASLIDPRPRASPRCLAVDFLPSDRSSTIHDVHHLKAIAIRREESGPRIGNLRTLIEHGVPELILLDIAFSPRRVPRGQ